MMDSHSTQTHTHTNTQFCAMAKLSAHGEELLFVWSVRFRHYARTSWADAKNDQQTKTQLECIFSYLPKVVPYSLQLLLKLCDEIILFEENMKLCSCYSFFCNSLFLRPPSHDHLVDIMHRTHASSFRSLRRTINDINETVQSSEARCAM